MTTARTLRSTTLAANSYRKIAERTAILYGRELDRLNSRGRSRRSQTS
jgi:hypothetical protein